MIEIQPHFLYHPKEIATVLGRRCYEQLRANGLQSLSGWCIGEKIIESFLRALARKTSRSIASQNEEGYETGCEEEITEDDFLERPLQFVLENPRPDNLESQLQDFQRRTERVQKISANVSPRN